MVISELCAEVKNILETAHIPDSGFDSRCIIEDIGGYSYSYCCTHSGEEADPHKAERSLSAAHRRAGGYPLQYILGEWEFYGLRFKVGEGVLIPRPDTEALVDAAVSRLNAMPPAAGQRLLAIDLCSGSGCIAAAMAKSLGNAAELIAVEKSSDAFPYLVENIRRNSPEVKLLKGDVFDGRLLDNFLAEDDPGEYRAVDCIVSNPPYLTAADMNALQTEVSYEPHSALYGGDDGLKFYRVIITLWSVILRIGGLMIFEIDPGQEQDVRTLFECADFERIFTEKDASGSVRVIGAYKRRSSD